MIFGYTKVNPYLAYCIVWRFWFCL